MPVPSFTQELIDQGVVEGRAEILRAVLRERFGDERRIRAAAGRLAHLDPDEIAERVYAAESLDDLV